MRTSRRRYRCIVLAAAVIAAGALVTLQAAADLAIEDVTVAGSRLQITVANLGSTTADGTVFARVGQASGVWEGRASLTVGAGRSAHVVLDAPEPIEGVIQLGVVLDDGSPF